MPTVSAFHSTKPGTEVHHNNSGCWDGNNIESRYRADGTGGHRLCSTCSDLNAQGK